MTALHYTERDLHYANHQTELKAHPETMLYLDAAHLGLGNGSCGPRTMERYILRAHPMAFRYSMLPWNSKSGDPAEVAAKTPPGRSSK